MRERVLGSKVFVTLTLCISLVQGVIALPLASAQDDGTKAQDQDARQLFEAGRSAYDEGRYKEALARFQAAYALSGRPALLFNIGQAADRLRNDQLALQSFEQFVAALPEAPNRAAVEERIALLREVIDAKQQQAAPVATPSEAAQSTEPTAAPSTVEVLQAPEQTPSDDDGLLSQWWFWAAAGGVAAGVVVVAIVVAGGGSTEQGDQTLGSDDRVVLALRY